LKNLLFAAPSISLNAQVALRMDSGTPYNFNVISVTIPNVPSDPTNNEFRSYPALDFLDLLEVLMISPSYLILVFFDLQVKQL
jgi:hypothetical protein